jgi:hypothetical protein
VAVKAYLVLITFMVAGAIASAWVPAFRVSHIHDVEDAILLAMLITSWAGLIPVYWSRTALAGVPRQMRALARLLAERDESIKADLETAKKEIAEEFKKSQNQLVDTVTAAKEQLVNTVEDATRSKLEGFPEVFKKAFEMIQQAQDKLYLINFAMNFGAPHLCNSEFRETYSKKFRGRDLEADVSKFFETLQIKVAQISDVQILTVNNEGCLTNFLEPLSQRDGYRNSMNVAEQRRNAEEAKTEIRKWLNLRSSGKTFVEATSLPIQLLITGLPPDAKHPNGGVGCLVFMVGTEVLKSDLEPGEEPAFYTELESMSSMFSKLALALIQSAKRDQGEQAYESRRIGA